MEFFYDRKREKVIFTLTSFHHFPAFAGENKSKSCGKSWKSNEQILGNIEGKSHENACQQFTCQRVFKGAKEHFVILILNFF